MLSLINAERKQYFTQFIEKNRYDQRKLFRASKTLMNLHTEKALPPRTDAYSLAKAMGEFFVQKINTKDRQLIASRLVTDHCLYRQMSLVHGRDIVLSNFRA